MIIRRATRRRSAWSTWAAEGTAGRNRLSLRNIGSRVNSICAALAALKLSNSQSGPPLPGRLPPARCVLPVPSARRGLPGGSLHPRSRWHRLQEPRRDQRHRHLAHGTPPVPRSFSSRAPMPWPTNGPRFLAAERAAVDANRQRWLRRWMSGSALILALALLTAGSAAAQKRCAFSVADDATNEYSYRERGGNRCEGTCGRQLANSTQLRIVGFSRGTTPVRSDNSSLSLRWAALPPAPSATLVVSSVVGPYCYRMDKVLPRHANGFQWPAHLVREIGVAPSALVGLIRIARSEPSESDSMLVPVERVGPSADNEPLIVQVVPGRDFHELYFTLSASAGRRVFAANSSLGQSYYSEGRVVQFQLPRTIPVGEPVSLHLFGRYPGGSNSTDVLLWVPR